jgi:hypothetical protein
VLEGSNSGRVIDYLEKQEVSFKYCRLCESLISETLTRPIEHIKQTVNDHFTSKVHLKKREELSIKEIEDLSNSMI